MNVSSHDLIVKYLELNHIFRTAFYFDEKFWSKKMFKLKFHWKFSFRSSAGNSLTAMVSFMNFLIKCSKTKHKTQQQKFASIKSFIFCFCKLKFSAADLIAYIVLAGSGWFWPFFFLLSKFSSLSQSISFFFH